MILRASLVHNFKLKNYLCMSRTQWGGGEPGTAPAWPRVWNKRIHINNMNTRYKREVISQRQKQIFSINGEYFPLFGGWRVVGILSLLPQTWGLVSYAPSKNIETSLNYIGLLDLSFWLFYGSNKFILCFSSFLGTWVGWISYELLRMCRALPTPSVVGLSY